jgi:hypothetical protein
MNTTATDAPKWSGWWRPDRKSAWRLLVSGAPDFGSAWALLLGRLPGRGQGSESLVTPADRDPNDRQAAGGSRQRRLF